MKQLVIFAALAASLLVSACSVVREREVQTRPAAPATVIIP